MDFNDWWVIETKEGFWLCSQYAFTDSPFFLKLIKAKKVKLIDNERFGICKETLSEVVLNALEVVKIVRAKELGLMEGKDAPEKGTLFC